MTVSAVALVAAGMVMATAKDAEEPEEAANRKGTPSTTYIVANVVENGGLGFSESNVMVRMTPVSGGSIRRIGTSEVYADGGGFYADGAYYTTRLERNPSGAVIRAYNLVYDAESWTCLKTSSILPVKGLSTVSLASSWDEMTSKAYGCYRTKEGSGLVFASMDRNFNVTEIAPVAESHAWLAASFDGNGVLYAVERNGDLVRVDISDGITHRIGNTGLSSSHTSAGAIDRTTGIFYMTRIKDDFSATTLYGIDTATARATPLCDLPGGATRLGAMYVMDPIAADKAPAAPEEVTFDFREGSLEGTIGFRIPGVSYDGEAASGNVSYIILHDNALIAKGEAQFGNKVESRVIFSHEGKKTVSIILSNASGSGPAAMVTSGWIGTDTPLAPEILTARVEGHRIHLSWNKVTGTRNGGYMNRANVRYTVFRSNPDRPLSINQSDTILSYYLTDAETFEVHDFKVWAECDGKTSGSTSANVVSGYMVPPYEKMINSTGAMRGYTVVDANQDGDSWKFYNSSAMMVSRHGEVSDDYLILPPMKLEGGKVYTFSFDAKGYDNEGTERFRAVAGKRAEQSGMGIALSDTVTLQSGDYSRYSYSVKAPDSGIMYFGVHCVSPRGGCNGAKLPKGLYVTNIRVSQALSPQAPAAPVAEAAGDGTGKLMTDIMVTAPTTDYDGNPVADLDSILIVRDREVIGRIEKPVTGENYYCRDSLSQAGHNTYIIMAYNSEGPGPETVATSFVGFTLPCAPEKVITEEEGHSGIVNVSWKPVTEDINSRVYPEGAVTYTVRDKTNVIVAEGLEEPRVTLIAVKEGESAFVRYSVTAVTAEGKSETTVGNVIPAGRVATLPYRESFPSGRLSGPYPVGYELNEAGSGLVTLMPDEALVESGAEGDSNGDNGCMMIRFLTEGASARFYTIGLDLRKLGETDLPIYNISAYAFPTEDGGGTRMNRTSLVCRETGTMEWKVVGTYPEESFAEPGWHLLEADLSMFKGKVVQVGVSVEYDANEYSLFDCVTLTVAHDYDLEASGIDTPTSIGVNQKDYVSVGIINRGLRKADGYHVDLLVNGEPYSRMEGRALNTCEKDTLEFPVIFSPLDEADMRVQAIVTWDKDMVLSNNKTEEANMKLMLPMTPVVTDLEAEEPLARTARLRWNAPEDVLYDDTGRLEVEGYHVYRDGKRITGTPVEAGLYEDTGAEPGDHVYAVTVMYDSAGESCASNKVIVKIDPNHAGLDSIGAGDMSIRSIPGAIEICTDSRREVAVIGMDGIFNFRTTVEGKEMLPVPPGIYLVLTDIGYEKLMVP